MIELRLYLRIPPKRASSLLVALQALERQTQLQRGCVETHLFAECRDPQNLCYTEMWDTEENLCLMLCSEHFTRLAELMETAAEPPVLDFRTITAIRGLEFARQARHGRSDPQTGDVALPVATDPSPMSDDHPVDHTPN
jgi:quinol monooxygenase YgiN